MGQKFWPKWVSFRWPLTLVNGWVSDEEVDSALTADFGTPAEKVSGRRAALLIVLADLDVSVVDCVDVQSWVGPFHHSNAWADQDDASGSEFESLADEALELLSAMEDPISDPFDRYIKEIGPKKLLSREEEQALGFEIQQAVRQSLMAIARSRAAVAELIRLLEAAVKGELSVTALVDQGRDSGAAMSLRPENLFAEADPSDEDVWSIEGTEAAGAQDASVPQELGKVVDQLRTLHLAIASAASVHEKELLQARVNALIHELHPTQQLAERLWAVVRAVEPSSAARATLEASIQRILAAKSQFSFCNLRLVLWVQRRYWGLTAMDRIQEGNIGLLKAIDRFDPARGSRFSTYAIWWVRQTITRAIADQGRAIRHPVHVFESMRKLEVASEKLRNDLDREPTAEELGAEADLSEEQVGRILALPEDAIPIPDLPDHLRLSIGQMPDNQFPSPEEFAIQCGTTEAVDAAVDSLDEREADVIRLRFGLGDDRDHTLEEVGRKYGLTRERIRQIEAKALRLLRHPSRSSALADFYELFASRDGNS